jgi:hypothetical protein
MDPESELLSDAPVRLQRATAPPEPRRLRSARSGWWWVVALGLVVACASVVVDAHSRDRESAAVGRCERDLQVATWYTQGSLGLLTNYLRPAPRSGGRVQQLHLADLMSERAGSLLPRVQRAARTCRSVEVHPWHFSVVARQSAASAYSAALLTLVQLVAAQGHVTFQDDETLQRLGDAVGVNAG